MFYFNKRFNNCTSTEMYNINKCILIYVKIKKVNVEIVGINENFLNESLEYTSGLLLVHSQTNK